MDKMSIEQLYQEIGHEAISVDPDYMDRRDKAVEKYFGHAKVIYPNPFA